MAQNDNPIPEKDWQSLLRAAYLTAQECLTPLATQEQDALQQWLAAHPQHQAWHSYVSHPDNLKKLAAEYESAQQLAILGWDKFSDTHLQSFLVTPAQPAGNVSVHFLRRSLFRYAAAILFFMVIGAAVVMSVLHRKNDQLASNTHTAGSIVPGSNRAMLTLADGSTIILDSAGNGAIAQQGNVRVVKLANGQIVYEPQGATQGEVLINTMSTPRGGQYQLTLPDGTKVWLNAASSISYPAVFTGKKREVKMTGEAYFEVAANREIPFIVDIDGRSAIEVLGTQFNVNSYANENDIAATLLEGSVKVSSTAIPAAILLKPGQQARITEHAGHIALLDHTDMNRVMAWKNGFFSLENIGFAELARQLERWYDIEVKYEGAIPSIKFKGDMDRGVQLSDVMKMLTKLGVHCRVEGRTLIIAA